MTELFNSLINKVSATYIEVLMPFLIVLGVWVFSHIRIDKQGKRYWFSAKYEAKKSQGKLDTIVTETAHNRTDLLRLQILQCLDHRPDEVETICHLYAEYKKRPESPNGYIDRRVKEWRKKTGQGD
ncbi:hypothetical protein AGMMS49944_15890 [Spirochaetia bacterium]|nr:hypothetical protein AGMMS49944_15890 [Spirochaetia bacterium]